MRLSQRAGADFSGLVFQQTRDVRSNYERGRATSTARPLIPARTGRYAGFAFALERASALPVPMHAQIIFREVAHVR
jgi:hypothetical protein